MVYIYIILLDYSYIYFEKYKYIDYSNKNVILHL